MSDLPLIRKKPEGNAMPSDLALKLEIFIGPQGPTVNFYWNEDWGSKAQPAHSHQVFIVALDALFAAGLVILGKVPVPGLQVKPNPQAN